MLRSFLPIFKNFHCLGVQEGVVFRTSLIAGSLAVHWVGELVQTYLDGVNEMGSIHIVVLALEGDLFAASVVRDDIVDISEVQTFGITG